jgi:hypothetical protein
MSNWYPPRRPSLFTPVRRETWEPSPTGGLDTTIHEEQYTSFRNGRPRAGIAPVATRVVPPAPAPLEGVGQNGYCPSSAHPRIIEEGRRR